MRPFGSILRRLVPAAALLILAPLAAPAETITLLCGRHADLAQQLAESYGESVRASALSARGHVLELWADGDSWTLLAVMPSGRACLIDQGLRAVILAPPVPGDPA